MIPAHAASENTPMHKIAARRESQFGMVPFGCRGSQWRWNQPHAVPSASFGDFLQAERSSRV